MDFETFEPFEKIDDIKKMLNEFEIVEHTNKEDDYDILNDGELEIEVINKSNDENLSIRICCNELMLFFSYYHCHYFPFEYEYDSLKRDITGILTGEFSIASIFVNEKWMTTFVLDEEVCPRNSLEYFAEKSKPLPDEFIERIYSESVFVLVDNWKKDDCYEFSFPSIDNRGIEFNFPRRGRCIRYAVKDGVDYGSGSIKSYDDTVAFLKYVYVSDVAEKQFIEKNLIELLEDDARKSGATKIFANIENVDLQKYKSLGYIEIPKINDQKLSRLNGAEVIFDKTVLKLL